MASIAILTSAHDVCAIATRTRKRRKLPRILTENTPQSAVSTLISILWSPYWVTSRFNCVLREFKQNLHVWKVISSSHHTNVNTAFNNDAPLHVFEHSNKRDAINRRSTGCFAGDTNQSKKNVNVTTSKDARNDLKWREDSVENDKQTF